MKVKILGSKGFSAFRRAVRRSVDAVGLSLVLATGCASENGGESIRGIAQAAINDANVLTQHNDASRSGVQLQETTLTPAAINYDSFGPLYSRDVQGMIHAQPLYVNGVGGDPNKRWVFIATSENYVYAFDAAAEDANPVNRWVWRTRVTTPIPRGEFPTNNTFLDGAPNVGILATPVIVPQTNTMYVLAADAAVTPRRWRLFALDITNGAFKYPAQPGVDAAGTVTGPVDAFPGVNGNIPFRPLLHLARPGLLVMGTGATTRVYAAFGSFADVTPFHGWVFKFVDNNCAPRGTCSGLSLSALHCTSPYERFDAANPGIKEGGGGVWMSGTGLAGDPANMNVYLSTGNGMYRPSQTNPTPLGANSTESAMVVLEGFGLTPVAKWHPPNFGELQIKDMDLGSGGVLLLPAGANNPGRLVLGGKNGVFYVLRRDLASPDVAGKTGPTQAWQAFRNVHLPNRAEVPVPCTPGSNVLCATGWDHDMFESPNIHGTPIYFEGCCDNGAAFKRMYGWSEKDFLKAWNYNRDQGTFTTNPARVAPDATLNGMPGATLSISANGTTNGVVWALTPETNANRCGQENSGDLPNFQCDTVYRRKPGRLFAFNAATLQRLWDGYVPGYAKYATPTIADGRVYVPTFSGRFVAYGLKQQPVSTWRELTGPTKMTGATWPQVASWDGTRMDLFMRSTTDASMHRAWVNNTWLPAADWESHGGVLRSSPVVASWGLDRLDVIVRDTTNNLQEKLYTNPGGWGPWQATLPVGAMTSEPTVVTWGPNRLDVFAVNAAGVLQHAARDNTVWTGWEQHANCCGITLKPQGRIAVVVTTAPGTVVPGVRQWSTGQSLHLFARGSDNSLVYKRWTPNHGWEPALNAGWFSLGGVITSDPAAVSRGNKMLDVFVRNLDGELSRRFTLNASPDVALNAIAWSGWEDRAGAGANTSPEFAWMVTGADAPGQYSRPLVLSSGNGTMTLYVKGGDTVVHRIHYNGTYWTLWQKIRGGASGSDTEPVGLRTASDQLFLTRAGTVYHVEPPAALPP